jgi:hypothetical protein
VGERTGRDVGPETIGDVVQLGGQRGDLGLPPGDGRVAHRRDSPPENFMAVPSPSSGDGISTLEPGP